MIAERTIDPALLEKLTESPEHESIDIDIFLADEPAREELAYGALLDEEPHGEAILDRIETRAYASQEGLVQMLREMESSVAFADDAAALPGAVVLERFWSTNSIAARVTPRVLRQILERSDVLAVQPARYASLEELKDDEAVPKLIAATDAPMLTWSVRKINAPLLWARGITGNGIVAAVIDTGVNYDHDDLKARMWINPAFPRHGFDFADDDDDPMDQDGHGTACAGIVAGDGSAGRGTGVAPGASIMAVRVGGAERAFWRGMEFAMKQRADVISMSMTWKFPSSPNYPGWRRVCESLFAGGIVHANSIGNQGTDTTTYPIPFNIATPGNCPPPRLHPAMPIHAGMSSAVGCGATDSSDALAPYSGRGPAEWNSGPYADYPFGAGTHAGLIKPDVCAPGPGSESCNWRYRIDATAKPYRSFGGTSAATPHVAGCMVLLAHATRRSGLRPNPARILEALESTAVRISGQTRLKENHFGSGRVDVYAAYNFGVARGWWL